MKVYIINDQQIGYYNKEHAEEKVKELHEEMAEFELYRDRFDELDCLIEWETEDMDLVEIFKSNLPDLYNKFGKEKMLKMFDYFTEYPDFFETPIYNITEIEII